MQINALVPLVRELQRRNDQIDMLAVQPFYCEQIIPAIAKVKQIDMDKDLNTTDREHLENLELPLPSIVYKDNLYKEIFEKIKTRKKSLGQHVGKRSKANEEDK